jgi:predicted ATPase
MKFDIQIKNLGKIQEANIKVRPLTLIAGVNSSGKSFFTKSFYSILKALNENYIGDKIYNQLDIFVTLLKSVEKDYHNLNDQDRKNISDINKYAILLIKEIGNFSKSINLNENYKLIINDSLFVNYLKELDNLVKDFIFKLQNTQAEYNFHIAGIQSIVQEIFDLIENAENYYLDQLKQRIAKELQENFQIRSIHNLVSKFSDKMELKIENIGSLIIYNKKISCSIKNNIKNITTVTFFESPIFWHLKDVFENIEHKQTQYLTGIPKYFYDVANLLQLVPKDDVEFPDLLEKITKAINGQIVVSPTGSLVYKDDKYEYSLNTTALGISNLGMIGLLIEKNIVTKGSFLIIDEPETNLHPEWQMVLMEVLFELSKRGVNIVFATHSLDMVKCLEVIVQKAISQEEDLTDHIGINLLNREGKSEEMETELLQQIHQVKQELSAPYMAKYMESLNYD